MTKAYDHMGFHMQWVKLTVECVSTVGFKILFDGHELGPIIPQRDFEQGVPLFIYHLC